MVFVRIDPPGQGDGAIGAGALRWWKTPMTPSESGAGGNVEMWRAPATIKMQELDRGPQAEGSGNWQANWARVHYFDGIMRLYSKIFGA